MKTGLEKEDSGRLGFVTSCLFHQAIDLGEVRDWASHVLANEEGSSPVLITLCEFEDSPAKIFKAIGFVPHWPYSADEKLALLGIAAERGREPLDWPITRKQAIEKLGQYPQIESAFRKEFPFLNW